MTPLKRLLILTASAFAALPACAQVGVSTGEPLAPAPRDLAPSAAGEGLEVLGRGPVTWTRSMGLAVFRGVDGRDYAYTGTDGSCEGCPKGRLYAWDVTDPARPVLTDSLIVDARRVSGVAVNEGRTVAVITRQGAENRRNGIVFLDLAQPAHPRVAGEYWETLLGGAHSPSWSGTTVFVADDGTNELVAVDASTLSNAREAGRWGIPNSIDRELEHVTVRDGIAFLASGDDGVILLDVGNGVREGTLRRPRMISQFTYRTEWRGQRWGNTHWALPHTNAAGEKLLFVADEILPARMTLSRRVETAGYLHVLDISNPSNPREVASYAIPGSGIRALSVAGDTLLVAAHGGGVRALDVSGTLRGSIRDREIGWFPMSQEPSLAPGVPYAWEVAGHNGLVYATDANSGLWIARPASGAR